MKFPYHLFIFFLVINLSCSRDENEIPTADFEKRTYSIDSFVLSDLGDTIPVNQKLPIKGKRNEPNNLYKAVKVPVIRTPITEPAHDNIKLAGKSIVNYLEEESSPIVPGENGVPLPEKIIAKPIKTSSSFPKHVSAQLPSIKNNAACDIQNLDMEQGLLSNYVNSVYEDSKGVIWFGQSHGGVSSYDGHYFRHFSTDQGLSDGNVEVIYEDQKGGMWFGTYEGLSHFDGHSFTQYLKTENLRGKYVRCIAEDKNGIFWIGTDFGLIRFAWDHYLIYTAEQGLPNNAIKSLTTDQEGNLWIGTYSGVACFNGQGFITYTEKNGLSGNNVLSLFNDHEGNIWLGTTNGVNKFDGEKFTIYNSAQGLSDDRITSILEGSNGDLWLGTYGGGVNHFDGEKFTIYAKSTGLGENQIEDILEDRQGNLWFGTYGGGVSRLKLNSFVHFPVRSLNVWGIFEDHKGNIWFGSTTDGVTCYDGTNFTYFTSKEGLIGDVILSMEEDSKGNIWFGTYDSGVNRFDGQNFTQFTTEHGLSSNFIKTIIEDQQGNIWFATGTNGVSCFDGESFTQFTMNEGLISNDIAAVHEDEQGNIWFLSSQGHLSRYESDSSLYSGSITHYNLPIVTLSDYVCDIINGSQNDFWIPTAGGGVFQLQGQNWNQYKSKDGLTDNYVFSIEKDSKDNIWLGTLKGITLMKKKLEQGFSQDFFSNSYQIVKFEKPDGLTISDFNQESACFDTQQRMWWGTIKGVTMLDLENFRLPTKPPSSPQLISIEVSQNHVDFRNLVDSSYRRSVASGQALFQSFDSVKAFHNYPEGLILPHYLDHLSFYFSSTEFSSPHKIKYQYQLVGADKNWSEPSFESKAEYRNLGAGQYTFKVRAKGEAQQWSETFHYSFRISPPWWSTVPAFAVYFLLFAGLIWSIINWRLYYIRLHYEREMALAAEKSANEANEAKSTFLSTVSHELRTPLTSIIGFTKLNKRNLEKKIIPDLKDESTKSKKAALKVANNLQVVESEGLRLLALINELLDLAKIESGKMDWKMEALKPEDLIKRATISTSALFEQKTDLKLIKDIPENLPFINADHDRLLQVIINLISNAVKFSDKGYVKIGVTPNPNTLNSELLFFVEDTGSGIPPTHIDKVFERFKQVDENQKDKPKGTGLGLPICKEIVEHHKGEIWVESVVDKGSTFYFTIPIKSV